MPLSNGGPARGGFPLPLQGVAYFETVRQADTVQAAGIWVLGFAALFLTETAPDPALIRLLLAAACVWLVAVEASNFLVDDRLVLRAKTAIVFGFLIYIYLKPVLIAEWMKDVPPKATCTAAAASLLFLAIALSVYVMTNVRYTRTGGILETCSIEMPFNACLGLLLISVGAEFAKRAILLDWSGVRSVPLALIGAGPQPWAGGAFGDWRFVLAPINWLFALTPALSGITLLKARKDPLHRMVVLLIIPAVLLTLLFQRSRFAFIMSVFTILAILVLGEREYRRRRQVYWVCVACIPLMIICANLIHAQRQKGVLSSVVWGQAEVSSIEINTNPGTVLEDNLEFFAKAAKVVPEQIDYRSPWELYYYLIINPIPRYFWPNKPWMSQKYLGQIRPFYASISVVGDLYVYGGWPHIVVVAILFGFVLKKLDQFGRRRTPSEVGRLALYAYAAMCLFSFIRAFWNLVVQSYAFFILLAMLYLAKRILHARGFGSELGSTRRTTSTYQIYPPFPRPALSRRG